MDGLEIPSADAANTIGPSDQDATSHACLRNVSEHSVTSDLVQVIKDAHTEELVTPLTTRILEENAIEQADHSPVITHREVAAGDDESGGALVGSESDTAVQVEGNVNCSINNVATQEPMQELVHEISAIRSVLQSSAAIEQDNDLLQQIRAWSDRIRPTKCSSDTLSPALAATRLIPMTVPSDHPPDQSVLDTSAENEQCCTIDFDDGVYRGHVKRCVVPSFPVENVAASTQEVQDANLPTSDPPSTERLLPHGWGIVTSHKGLRRIGQWQEGEQVGIGSLQSAVFLYDGEWHATQGPSGYGVGTFAFGATFIGCWMNGRPYGLGRMYCAEPRTTQDGWFYGTHCLQPVVVVDDTELQHQELLKRHLPTERPTKQPHRGLFLVGEIVEEARLVSLRLAMEQWRRLACENVVAMARRIRLQAMHAWVEAHTAERQAIAWNMMNQIQLQRARLGDMLHEIAVAREKHKRVQRIREFHTNRLDTAIFQRDLARRCVASQQESITLMEAELAQVRVLVQEAKRAQDDCKSYSHQQQHVKRQIENASVKINALKHQLRLSTQDCDENHQQQRQQQQRHDAARHKLTTPATPAHARALHGPRSMKKMVDNELPFVCDVPGCTCGIPRDVFVRIAGALNGE